MNHLHALATSLSFPELHNQRNGRAAGVLLEPLSGSGERYCVAVLVEMENGETGASVTVNPKIARSILGGDLASSLLNFGQMAALDFQLLRQKKAGEKKWAPPFSGMFLTEWREMQGFDLPDVLNQASLTFATLSHTAEIVVSEAESDLRPRAAAEDLFRQGVRQLVANKKPNLDQFFERDMSAIGSGQATFRIDYFSPSIAACFTAINPVAPHRYLLSRAQASLWKIAAARDATPLFRPETAKLIAWLPEPGLPIYSVKDYDLTKEVEEELRYEAKKMDIGVVAKYRDSQAADYLVELEKSA